MKILEGGLGNVPGFTFSAIECGIRYQNRLDMALLFSAEPCHACGVFTQNKLCAAPVRLCRERINNPIQGILINATNANACTGEEGYKNALQLTANTAASLKVPEESILMASTGIIGVQLPVSKMADSIPSLASGLSADSGHDLSRAIMTTDTHPKEYAVSFESSAGTFTIAGTVKGSGMIAPNMATLLAFIITDFPIERKKLDDVFRACINSTLNAITIDGDTSTNDTAIILAPVKKTPVTEESDIEHFSQALLQLLEALSVMLVRDGEGTTKCVTVRVVGALSVEDAKKASRSIAESLLVKTALFGEDPNWGRVACAAGYSGAEMHEDKLTIDIENIPLLENGVPVEYSDKDIREILSRKSFVITVNLGLGEHSFSFLTSDLSYDYVKINAEYST